MKSIKLKAVLLLLILSLASTTALITNGGNVIAILASGDITDFGYSNTVNTGRINMESALNISGSLYAPNIEDQATAFAYMQQLVSEGYRLIISTTSDHGNASAMAAAIYPNVSFVQISGSTVLPNLSTLSFSGPDLYYSAGVFCGGMTKNNRVGFIHPGSPPASFSTLNAFYLGVKSLNPDAAVYVVFTNTYLDADRETGAAKILLNEVGVDQLAGQQDDLTVEIMAMNAGLLAVGISGYPLKDIYGQSIGMSVLKNWGAPFTIYAAGVLAHPTTVFKQNVNAGFASGYTTLDTPSYLVPTNVWSDILLGVQQLKNATKPYYCSPFVAELGVSNVTGCLTNTAVFGTHPLSAIVQMGTYIVPLQNVPFPETTEVAIIVLAGLLWIFSCSISGGLFYLRRDTVMLASSPLFLGLVLIGCAMVFTSTIAWVVAPSVAACEARIWMPSIGFTLCMGAMIIKNVRLWLIFDASMRKIRIRDTLLLAWIGVFLAADILLLGLWTGLGKPFVLTQQAVGGLSTYQIREVCSTTSLGDDLLYAIVALHGAQLLVGCIVTFKIRIIDIEEFNESSPFGLCIYIVSLVCVICGILIGSTATTSVQIIIIVCFSLLIGSAAVLFVLFVPKFLTIFVKGSRPIDKIIKSLRPKGSSSSNSGTTAAASGTSNPTPSKEPVQLQVI